MDELIKNAFKKSKLIALKYVKDLDTAEEVAQLASIQLYLNYNNIDKAKINSWIFTVTRNLCLDIYRKQRKEKTVFVDSTILNKTIAYNQDKIMEELDIDAYNFLSEADKKLLKKYYHDNVAIPKLAQYFKIKKNKLRRKINSLENEIKLYHLITSDVIYFNPLPATKLTKKINNFIRALIKALEISNFSSMKRYCKDAVIHDSIEKIKIKSYETCKIQITEDKNYQILIGYLDHDNKVKVFYIKFTITKSGNIQVLEMPIMPTKVLALDKKYVDPKYAERELLDRKGIYNNKLGTLDELEKRGIAKVTQTEDDF